MTETFIFLKDVFHSTLNQNHLENSFKIDHPSIRSYYLFILHVQKLFNPLDHHNLLNRIPEYSNHLFKANYQTN